MERNGLVERRAHSTAPPRVECTLTLAGQGLLATVDGMCVDISALPAHRGRPVALRRG
ncbi:winged helix-turn-helix transcriptional regulator [Streptomyces sp. NPDC049541]|uniref:winged helix-turn-helix transcriptional regulator n=1 Tax=Streptomyces sp. NPDC049541 TaxID=3365594 RepID=UPI00379547F0